MTFNVDTSKFITKHKGIPQFEEEFVSDVWVKLAVESKLLFLHHDDGLPPDNGHVWFDPAGNTAAARINDEGGYKWCPAADHTVAANWVSTVGMTPAQKRVLLARNIPINATLAIDANGALGTASGGGAGGYDMSQIVGGKIPITKNKNYKIIATQSAGLIFPRTDLVKDYNPYQFGSLTHAYPLTVDNNQSNAAGAGIYNNCTVGVDASADKTAVVEIYIRGKGASGELYITSLYRAYIPDTGTGAGGFASGLGGAGVVTPTYDANNEVFLACGAPSYTNYLGSWAATHNAAGGTYAGFTDIQSVEEW